MQVRLRRDVSIPADHHYPQEILERRLEDMRARLPSLSVIEWRMANMASVGGLRRGAPVWFRIIEDSKPKSQRVGN